MSFRMLLYISFYDSLRPNTNTFWVAFEGGCENVSSADSFPELVFLEGEDDSSWLATRCNKDRTDCHEFPSFLRSFKRKRLDNAIMTQITMMRVHAGYA